MKIDPVFPTGSQFTPPRYKFVRSTNGFHLVPHQNTPPQVVQEVVEPESTRTSDRALLFSLVILALVTLFG